MRLPNLHFSGKLLGCIWSLKRHSQRPSSANPTIKPVMFRVREVNREQHVMTSTFLGWVAYQLSSHRLLHWPETRNTWKPFSFSEADNLNITADPPSIMSQNNIHTLHYKAGFTKVVGFDQITDRSIDTLPLRVTDLKTWSYHCNNQWHLK